MERIIGLWQTYHRGEVYDALEQLFRDVVGKGFQLRVHLASGDVPIASAHDLVHQLQQVERTEGIRRLLELLMAGVTVTGQRQDEPRLQVTILLRATEGDRQGAGEFRSLIANWIEGNDLSFLDRCFKSTQPLFLHSPLERALKRRFGFRFQYKILIHQEA